MMGRRSSTPLEGEGRHTVQAKGRGVTHSTSQGEGCHTAQAKGRGVTHSTSQGEGCHTAQAKGRGVTHSTSQGEGRHTAQAKGRGVTHSTRQGEGHHTVQANGKGITHSRRWGSHAALLWTRPLLKLAVVVLDALEYRLGGMHCIRGETLCLANCSRLVHVSRQAWEHTQCGQLV